MKDRAAGPKIYDAAHRLLFRKRESSKKLGWERSLALAYEASKHVVGSVLDLGCGLGFLAKFVKGRYLGVDFSPYSVRQARQMDWNPKARFIEGDIRDLEIAGQFGTVTMLETLEHLDDPTQAIETARRLVRHRIIVSVPRQSRAGTHIWDDWNPQKLKALLGSGTVCYRYRRSWIAIWTKSTPTDLARSRNASGLNS